MKTSKICQFCGGEIPKEKIEEFESKFKAQESKIKEKFEEESKEKIKIERERAEEKLGQQKELFDEFKDTLKKEHEEELNRIRKDVEEINKERLKIKEEEISSIKSKLEEVNSEKEKIGEEIEKKYKKEIIELKSKNTEEKGNLISNFEKQIRDLESKTPTELGKEGQIEVLEVLTRAFQPDEISETKRGKAGSDIFHKILYNGEAVGLIVYEVKNVSNWDNSFIKQVKEQKAKHNANYAILVSNVLPSKEKVICEKDGIVIVNSSKVEIIAHQVRDFLIDAHKAKLTGEEIEEKIKVLQDYLISPEYKNALIDLVNATKLWRELRDKERTTHERHWAEEEKLNNKIHDKTAKIHTKIASIIETKIQKVPISAIYKQRRKK